MAAFFQELWESIFTPGPTPTLLIATNVTFAALQVVLASLLYMTYSVHFLVLSFLSAGLWWAINWFATELKVHQQEEEETAKRAHASAPIVATSDESETEVETSTASLGRGRKPAGKATGASKEVEPLDARGELKHRATEEASQESQGTKSSASTEDEWEKVSENEKEK